VGGDATAARTTLSRAAAERRATLRLWEPDFLLAEAWVLASAGELTRAVARAEQAASTAAATGQSMIEAVALHTCVRFGRGEQAVADRLHELAQEVDSSLVAASSDHASALVARNGAGLDRAASSFAATGARLAAAEAASHAAGAHRIAGRRASELASSARAAELTRICEGARPPALEHIADEVRLTPREREVGGLAARGNSNRDIAKRLVVSVRTVENHLDRMYAKLGLHSRKDLAVAFGVAAATNGVAPFASERLDRTARAS
jgi:ATP/maltotriose-dependent transcriptional regulator MalT